jgi:hypothetical protein
MYKVNSILCLIIPKLLTLSNVGQADKRDKAVRKPRTPPRDTDTQCVVHFHSRTDYTSVSLTQPKYKHVV